MSKLWKKQSDCFVEALDYVKQRQLGLIKSLKTPWPKFNDAGIDGIEWNSVLVIGARPGVGKSLIKDQIIRESFALNKDTQFRVLKFEFEMLGRATAIREFSSVLSKSYKYICSAESSLLQDAEYERMKQYSANVNTNPIDIIEKPVTVPDFIEIIHEYMKEHIVIGADTKPKYTNTVISIDHTWLFVRAKSEKDKLETMYALGEAVTYLKRIYPILFIILSQLNRNVENPERCENGKYGNLINDGDFFGSDAMNQHTDKK